jgi:hypothetical protein
MAFLFVRYAGRLVAASSLAFVAALPAQQITPTAGIDYPVIGKVQPRHARDIAASPWSIGGETIDRDFTNYEHYKKYLGPLGAKGIRLQAGWAKCEKQKGVYSWEWLDAIVNDAVAQGVRPWLELNYGNPIYPGGGDTGLGGGFPSSPEALAAWDKWCHAVVERYRDRVHEWEIWNEPDINNRGTAPADAYIDLYIRTAAIVRELQPRSQLWALALAHSAEYADAFLAGMKSRGKLELIDAITYHGYPRNPDDTSLADKLRAIIGKHGAKIPIRQGETGAPSRYQENFALSRIHWSETTHAKWDLRRLLAHHAKDIPMNLFTLSDMHYTQATNQTTVDGVIRMNYKGLLATKPDQTIAHAKPAYYAAQTVFAVFDDTVQRIPEYPFTSTFLRAIAVTGYRSTTKNDAQIATVYFNDAPPAEANGVTHADLILRAGQFTEPVLVDMRTSTVYSIPNDAWTQTANGAAFRNLPVYDSPLLIAERSAVGVAAAR